MSESLFVDAPTISAMIAIKWGIDNQQHPQPVVACDKPSADSHKNCGHSV